METSETTYKRTWVVMTWSIKIFKVILVFKQIQSTTFPFGIFAILQLSTIHEIYQKYPLFCFSNQTYGYTEKFISTCSMLDYKRIWNIGLDNLYGIIELL